MKRNKNFNNEPLLYLIATPIGNLKEMTPRALEVLSSCDLVAAEDTRNSGNLLKLFNICKPFYSLREHNESEASEYIIKQIKDGKKVCYMSDAGYPGISDPGNILVKKCIEEDIHVSAINGSSAFINALVCSSLPTNHFYFHGFLSPKESEASKELEEIKSKKETIIFYESPHRIIDTLKLIFKIVGDRKIVLARELTKLNEEFIFGTTKELSEIDPNSIKGEMVIILEGNNQESSVDDKELIDRVSYFVDKGLTKKDAIEVVSDEYKINKNYIKDLIMR